jgi:MGT family glycosyltransferase
MLTDAAPKPATFLLTTWKDTGHLLRILDLAEGLRARGHRVLVHTHASAADTVKASSIEFVPFARVSDFVEQARRAMAERPWWMPKLVVARSTLYEHSLQLARELESILRREKVDCLVGDYTSWGAAWAAERVGIPYASAGNPGSIVMSDELLLTFLEAPPFRIFTWSPALAHAAGDRLLPLRAARADFGLRPSPDRTAELVRSAISRELHIITAHRGFAGDTPLRDNQLFVGSTEFNVSTDDRRDTMHIEPGTVVASTTTTHMDGGLFRRVLEAVSTMRIPILATSSGADDIPAGLGAHIRIERYIPHDVVFPRARALITHGGWGTVGRALLHGLPMLVIPLFGDQLLNAKLVERAGLGRRLPLAKATPEAIRAELRALLADHALHARAQRVAAEIKQLKAEQVAARALEQLALRGKVSAPAEALSHGAGRAELVSSL